MNTVRTRIAPSPTGFPHIGTIYQAMFDYVLARKYNGQFIVRIEDTDRARFVEGAEDVIFKSLKWFNLVPDEDPIKGGPYGPYRQSERLKIYKGYVDSLLEKGFAYRCFCSKERLEEMRKDQQAKGLPPMYDRLCLRLSQQEVQKRVDENIPFAIRMKIPSDRMIRVHDSLAGDVEFDSDLIDDQVILKSDGFPTYHLAVVVDDYLMKITHIIRGKEWLSSTPKHVLLYEFLGWKDMMPVFTHLPLILSSNGKGKLSKREGHASVDYYIKEGFLPEAILNYLSNIMWNHPEDKEIYPLKDLELAVDINSPSVINITSQAARFDLRKLEWMNGEYIRQTQNSKLKTQIWNYLMELSDGALAKKGRPTQEDIERLIPLIKERIKKLSDFIPLTDFLFETVEYEAGLFQKIYPKWKEVLEQAFSKLESLPKPWQKEDFEKTFQELAKTLGLSNTQMFQLIRLSVSGQLVTPPLFESIKILGEDETVKRVKTAKDLKAS